MSGWRLTSAPGMMLARIASHRGRSSMASTIDECALALESGPRRCRDPHRHDWTEYSRQDSDPRAVPPAERASRFAAGLLWGFSKSLDTRLAEGVKREQVLSKLSF